MSRLTIGTDVPHLLETLARRAAHTLRRRIGRAQFGMLGLELLEPLHEPVERGVGNFRIVRDVIEVLIPANLLAETFDLFGGVAGLCGSGLGHGNLSD